MSRLCKIGEIARDHTLTSERYQDKGLISASILCGKGGLLFYTYRRKISKRARTVLTDIGYSAGNVTRHGSSLLTRFIDQLAIAHHSLEQYISAGIYAWAINLHTRQNAMSGLYSEDGILPGTVVIASPYRPSRYSAGIFCRRSRYIHTGYNASFGCGCSAVPGKPNSALVCQQALPVQLAVVD